MAQRIANFDIFYSRILRGPKPYFVIFNVNANDQDTVLTFLEQLQTSNQQYFTEAHEQNRGNPNFNLESVVLSKATIKKIGKNNFVARR